MGMWNRRAINCAWDILPTLDRSQLGSSVCMTMNSLSHSIKRVGMAELMALLLDEICGQLFVELTDLVKTMCWAINSMFHEFLLLCVSRRISAEHVIMASQVMRVWAP